MEITNPKTGQRLDKVILAKTIFAKARGLMFAKPQALLMAFAKPQYISLHTFFVFFPLQVYYLDATLKVMEQTVMQPFTFYSPSHLAQYILEVPAGVFTAEVGDSLDVKTRISLLRER
ncbi:DUF192 domain-containing protein [Candidatus Woesearchaeota archaeon]|nr:DUF192 domain-containing protein [Candidatus Woesearchaeota archaeon]